MYFPHSISHVRVCEMSFDETEESVDYLVHDVFQYLKDGKYPDSCTLSHKRNIRRKLHVRDLN